MPRSYKRNTNAASRPTTVERKTVHDEIVTSDLVEAVEKAATVAEEFQSNTQQPKPKSKARRRAASGTLPQAA